MLSLGYNCSPSSLDLATTTALKVTRSRKAERRARKVTRNVFLCYVLGAAGSGKTSLLRSFVQGGRRDPRQDEGYEPTSKVVSVVNSVEVGGGEKYLVVRGPTRPQAFPPADPFMHAGPSRGSSKNSAPNTNRKRFAVHADSKRPT